MTRRIGALLGILAALLLPACSALGGAEPAEAPTAAPAPTAAAEQSDPLRLVIGAGGAGGVFVPYADGLAGVLNAHLPETEARAQETGGSVDNMRLLQVGEAQLGLATADTALDAVNGAGAYQETGRVPAAALAVLYQSYVHVIASEQSGITRVEDFAGRPIGVGTAGSSTEAVADRLLAAAGLDPQADVTRVSLGLAETVAALEQGEIDAFVWVGGLPTAAITELVASERVTFLDASALLEPMVEEYGPTYTAMTLPQDVYGGLEGDVAGIGVGNVLFAHSDMPASQVTGILETIFDNLGELQQSHPAAQSLALETAAVGSPIPFHPAAESFYKARGVWQEPAAQQPTEQPVQQPTEQPAQQP